MNSFKIIITLLLSVTINLSAQETKVIDLGSFDELKVYDRIHVILVQSTENKAVISGYKQDDVKVILENGEVKIRMEIENILDGEEITVKLHHTDELSLIDANENAKISSENEINSRYLTVRAQEGGEIDITLSTPTLRSKAVTGGVIRIAGEADNQEVIVRTGGTYNGKDLVSDQADVMVFAGGKAFVHATDFVEANVTAGGTIEIFGDPKVRENSTLGGSIVIH